MNKKECKIVQDLLPNYIDGISSEETNQYIENHLKECSECTAMLNNMKNEIKTKVTPKDKSTINYFKKYKNKLKFLRITLLLIFVVFIILTLRKFIIMTNLEKNSEGFKNVNNYYTERYSLQGSTVNIVKAYKKYNVVLSTYSTYGINIDEIRRLTIYKSENEKLGIIQSGEHKIADLSGNILGGLEDIHTYSLYEMNLFSKLLLSTFTHISSDKLNGRECYYIEQAKGWKLWVDKENGLILREANASIITDYSYKFDIVTDENIEKPDISDCELINNNK